MPKTNRTYAGRWTPFKKDMLEQLRNDGMSWPEIAVRMGHPLNSCQSTLATIRRKRRREQGEEPVRHKIAPVFMQAPIAPLPEPSERRRSVSTLISDAELRARIEILGPNGLLGDPLPGRSALDQRNMDSST